MDFKSFILEADSKDRDIGSTDVDTETPFTKEDITEILDLLEPEEIQQLGEICLNMLECSGDDDIDCLVDDLDLDSEDPEDPETNEAVYFKKKAHQVKKDKKKNKSDRRKAAKKRKQWYKKNKAKVRRYNKKAAKRKRTGKTVGGKRITKHR